MNVITKSTNKSDAHFLAYHGKGIFSAGKTEETSESFKTADTVLYHFALLAAKGDLGAMYIMKGLIDWKEENKYLI